MNCNLKLFNCSYCGCTNAVYDSYLEHMTQRIFNNEVDENEMVIKVLCALCRGSLLDKFKLEKHEFYIIPPKIVIHAIWYVSGKLDELMKFLCLDKFDDWSSAEKQRLYEHDLAILKNTLHVM